MNENALNEEDLSKVSGGVIDWSSFYNGLMSLVDFSAPGTDPRYELILEFIMDRNYRMAYETINELRAENDPIISQLEMYL